MTDQQAIRLTTLTESMSPTPKDAPELDETLSLANKWLADSLSDDAVPPIAPADRHATLMAIQKGLLDCHNFIVGTRGGWIEGTDEEYWELTKGAFSTADALLRQLLREAGDRHGRFRAPEPATELRDAEDHA
jgi:hypothetical protein